MVREDEESLPKMPSADFLRRKESFRNPETHLLQVCRDRSVSQTEMSPDVFEEDPFRLALGDDPGDVRPEVPLVLLSRASSRHAEGLARVARKDAIHDSTPSSAVEGGKIRPQRRRSHETLFHARRQERAEIGFPLHVADAASAGNSQSGAEVESPVSGAEREQIPAGSIHTFNPLLSRSLRR